MTRGEKYTAENVNDIIDNFSEYKAVPRCKVLLLDSNSETTWATGQFLLREGFNVVPTCFWKEAQQLVSNDSFDMVIMELQPAGLRELPFLRWLTKNHPDLLTVVYTVNYSLVFRDLCLQAGADLYLEKKPLDTSLLVEILRLHGVTSEKKQDAQLDLIQTLLDASRDGEGGEVLVRSGDQTGRVFFVEEKVAWAALTGQRCSLMEMLIEQTQILPEELKQVFEECLAKKNNFAEQLISRQLITSTTMRAILLQWIGYCLNKMLDWSKAEVEWVPLKRAYHSDLIFDLDEVFTSSTGSRIAA